MQNTKIKLREYDIQFFELSEKTWKEECVYVTKFHAETRNEADALSTALFVARELAFSSLEFTSFHVWEIKHVDLENDPNHEYISDIAYISICSNQFTDR